MENWFVRYKVGALLAIAGCVFLTGFLGSLVTDVSPGSWYTLIRKPSWNPPSWVFGPVWTALYILIAVSGWLLWRKHRTYGAKMPIAFFVLQLVLNALWSVLFFGLESPLLAAMEILLLWLVIGAYIATSKRVDSTASLLFVPYWLWVSFASVLTFSILSLNS